MNDALEIFADAFSPPPDAPGGAIAVSSLTGAADAFLALTRGGFVLAAVPGLPDADRLLADLGILGANGPHRILELPPPDAGDRSAAGRRLRTIAAVRAWETRPHPCVVVASYPALAAPVPKRSPTAIGLSLHGGLRFGELCDALAKNGYGRVPAVGQEGDFSVRGGIVDAWGPGDEFPVRAEFFGEELESLRVFDAATQISVGKIASAELPPAESRDGEDDIGFFDILPSSATVLALEHNSYTLPENRFRTIYTGDPAPAGVASYGFQTSPLPGFSELGAGEAHHPELFDAARRRLESHLEAARKRGCAIFGIEGLSGGFEIPGMIVVSKADRVFAKRKTVSRRGSAQGARLNDFDEIEPGEYVVHVDYGVGRYIGSSEIETGGGRRNEVFTIEYADGAKLHVPAAHAHLLSRYVGVKGEKVRLHRLDGKRWEKDRQNAQKAVNDLAAALLETQARREIMPGFPYDTACEGLDAFEAAFPYEETGDQLAAIEAVKKDMAARKPMDRLICGDAGYGKTEVAMRAAYIAALNGKQTAVLAPTTVLAEQHFETFSSRFDGTPVRIEPVSRFQSSGVHGGTFRRLASGACDIVIGTHAILSPKVTFRDLGLIIIDEEQRFGVRQKEALKRLRATADVLALSATPIPRTLYLSMTGARDLSLLKTPPRDRVAVETAVVRDSDATVKRAIESELARGGQVFFLHNRIATIGRVERRLAGICPGVRIAVAHGKMDSLALARKMRDFERGEFDVLLSTAIVESGIDIPRANTIIVDRADTFGLADLYQLRGRVGRGSRQGYAYFLLNASGTVDSDARERLSALKRHGGLGAGFSLAVRDLELRGAGNLLGSQQSGHIAAIGFGLYCQLLKRTVSMLKGEKVDAVADCRLNLDFVNPCLPYDYIEDDAQRLGLLRRFAEARDEAAVGALAREMRDRFGPPPPDAAQFVQVARLRTFCAKAGIRQVDASGDRAIFYRAGSQKAAFVRGLEGKTAERKIGEIKAAAAGA